MSSDRDLDARARARSIVAEVLASAASPETPASHSSATPTAMADGADEVAAASDVGDGSPLPEAGSRSSSATVPPRSAAGEAAHRIVQAVLAAQQADEGGVVADAGARASDADAPVGGAAARADETAAITARADDLDERASAPVVVVPEPEPVVVSEPEPVVVSKPEPTAEPTTPEPEPVGVTAEPDPVAVAPEPADIAAEDRMRQLFAASAPEPAEDGSSAAEPELVDGSDEPWSLDGDLTTAGTTPSRSGRWLLATILGAIALALLFPLAVAALRQVLALS